MDEILKFKVISPWTGDEVTLEYHINHRRWDCSKCGKGKRCIHGDAVIHEFEVEQIIEVSRKKVKPMPAIAETVDRSMESER